MRIRTLATDAERLGKCCHPMTFTLPDKTGAYLMRCCHVCGGWVEVLDSDGNPVKSGGIPDTLSSGERLAKR